MDEEDISKLSVEERCQHKVWKARVSGYEEAEKLFLSQTDEKSPEFSKYLGLVKKFVVDNNLVAQIKGLGAVLAFVENAACAGKTCGEVMNGIVNKCLGSPKAKTRELAQDIILMYIEIEKHEIVQEELLKGLENKNPKIVSSVTAVFRDALQCFGPTVINLKPLIKMLPKLLEDRDKSVREEAKQLTVEIYRWIKEGIRPHLQSLKPVQVTELEAEFEKVSQDRAKPTRFLRSQQEIQQGEKTGGANSEPGYEDEYDSPQVAEIDPYDLVEAVDILAKLPKDFYERCEAKKWQERKEAVEMLHQLTSSPKLESGDYGELIRTLKKLLTKDTNVLVVALAGKCLAGLATGLRKRFQPYAGQCISAILEKFKEKKQNVVTALREAIDAIYETVTLEFVLEDAVNALDNKNPQIKAETAAFLARCFTKCTPMILTKKLLKPFCVALVKTLNDTDPSVREASADALGTALKVVGEKVMTPFLQEVDSIKMAKVKESCEKAVIIAPVVPVKENKRPLKVQKSEKPPAESGGDGASDTNASSSKRNVPSRIKTATFTKSTKKAIMSGKRGVATPPSADGQMDFFSERELSDDDVLTQGCEFLSEDVVNGLASVNWKERLVATEKFMEIVQNMEKGNIPAQVFIRILAKKPGFKENNFQVLKLRFELLIFIAENSPISQTTVKFCLSDIVDKIGDPKNGNLAASALTALAEATSLEYIGQEVLQLAFSQRNPKNQSEALLWLANAVKEFGLKVNVKGVIEYLKKAFSSTNPTVRNSALTLLGSIYVYVGKSLRTFFEDEKPALLQLIDNELAKLQDTKPVPPIRGVNSKNNGEETADKEENPSVPPTNMADLIPRTDIADQITPNMLTELSDKNWKVRAEAIQKLSAIVNEAKFITPNLGDLPHVLKARLTDSNKNLAIQSLNICQMLGTAMGPNCIKQIRNFAPGMLAALGDNKNTVRNAALTCLNTWVEHCGIAVLFEGETVSDALRTENPFLRTELLGWLSEKLPGAKSLPNAELILCVPYILACLEDRNSDVRKKAQDSLLPFMTHIGFDPMARAASKLKPASKNTVMQQLEKVRTLVPVKAPTKPKAQPQKIASANPTPQANTTSISPVNSTENLVEDGGLAAIKGRLHRSTSKSKLALKAAGGGTTKGGKKEEEQDTSPALVTNNLKDQRMNDEKSLKVLKWNFTSPREEFYQQLKDQMTAANWGRTLLINCFHNDFKYHIKAIEILIECLSNLEATIANLDLILKWLALRFFDTNPSVLIRGLEYLQQLFGCLVNVGYRLLELEAASFVPYLILKMGDPKDAVRKGVREILKLMCQIYPSSKVFTFIMQGLSTKNSRQRTECLEVLGYLIETYGMVVCQPSPAAAMKEIARQIADRDNGVRNAALNCVVQAYFLEGEKLYKYVGHLSDKDMSLLEERIKRSRSRGFSAQKENQRDANSTTQTNKISPPSQHPASAGSELQSEAVLRTSGKGKVPRPRSTGPFCLEVDDIEQMFKPKQQEKLPEPVEINADEILGLPDIQLPQTRLRPPASAVKLLNSSAEATMALNLVMAQLAAQEIPVVVEAFAQVEEVLRQEDKAEAVLGSRVDQLLLMGALQYRLAHNKHMADENICKADVIRLYRCVTMTLVSLFDHKTLAKRASRDVLRDLIPHLVTVMLDTRLNELQEGPQVVRAINVLTVRILQRSNPTHVMSALVKLLHDCVGSLNASERFTELVMKCLWKMLRMMGQYINELNVDRILLDLHVFLKTYPSSYWKDRPSDTPIRTIKTILYTLVKYKGEDITKHLMLIPNRQDSDLVIYLQKLICMRKDGDQKGGSSNKASSGVPGSDIQPEAGSKKSKSSPMRLSKSTHEALAEIFKKIGSKEHTKEGLMELYEFRQRHPQADIEPFLQRSSEFFQDYIRKGLEAIEQERGPRRSDASGNSPVPLGSADLQSTNVTTLTSTNCNATKENHPVSSNGTQDNSNAGMWLHQGFPPLPPDSEDTTPMDWIEWLKSVAALLGQDGSKYDDPAILQKIAEQTGEPGESGLYSEEQMDSIRDGVEEIKGILEDFKQQYYKEMCVN